ncbi:hypothetical protein DZA65_04376 [Dickeya dianthicola]|uniref:DUF3261 domain-containing protein n=2 Tax=Dickeya TaxID=204037 RepID=A0AAP2D3X6_9GAMM|nr:DUF3261 domain-containing protein [Dickeya dianthicola]ATO35431.1 hypothetical protein DDI_4263 [Dickeya dianthicola RNS04.9]AYC21203.1 hypothetical protein DZA65_04376 [Dickeya dianthicola]MBI0437973.1 DUF3261 domain-containing protein [Dickeya dianthicola]MBI0448176.1 DUF3261 domain-containing protein [Dickeya dianthicola]MBI0452790.1 DUF3261 domain-containing protein [Dickeya dianthicola]
MRESAKLILMAAVLLLSACAGKPSDPRPQAWLKPGVKVTLPAPGISPTVEQQQLLTGSYQGKQQSLLVMLQADPRQLSLVGLSSLGIRLFRITYDAAGVHTEQSLVLPELPPASQVLADIMLSHWPLSVWQKQLPAGWTLNDDGDTRRLRDNHGELIVEIRYRQRNNQREPVSVKHLAFGYHIVIQYLDG